jgi:transglutaminase-like putative cysteine protease
VDAFGRLVAEGLAGSEGPEGPAGPEGPRGPAGQDGEGVPTPYGQDGTVLTIVDGSPQWATPAGPPPSILWADQLTSDSGWYQDDEASPYAAFDGNTNTAAIAKIANNWLNLTIPYEFQAQSFEVQFGQGITQAYAFEMGAISGQLQSTSNEDDWIMVSRVFGEVFPANTVFKIKYDKNITMLRGVKINGEQLLDPRAVALSACVPGYATSIKQVLRGLIPTTDIDPS